MSASSSAASASTIVPPSSTPAAPSAQHPSAPFSLTTDATALTSSAATGVTLTPLLPVGYGYDLSGVTLNRIRTVMSHKEWSGDTDDRFIKRLVNEDVNIYEALTVLVHDHIDARMDLASRVDDLSASMLIRLCRAIGLSYVPSGKKKEDPVLLRKQIMDFVLHHAKKHPSLVMSHTSAGPSRSKSNTSSREEAKAETSENEESQTDRDESGEEPVTPPPPSRPSVNVAPRSSPRTTKGVREFIPPPGSSKLTSHRKLDLPVTSKPTVASQSLLSDLPADVLKALAMLPNPKQEESIPSHKSRGTSNQKKLTGRRRVAVTPTQSDETDSDSDGPSTTQSVRDKKVRKEGRKGKEKKKKKKQTRRSHSHSRHRHHRHRSNSASSSSDSVSDSDVSSSFNDSTSDLTTDSDSHSTKRHHHRSRSSRPLVVYTPGRHGDVDDVHDGITSLGLTQPLAKAFLSNVYRTSKTVHDAYEKIEFRQTRNQRECLVLARIIDLLERKKYSRALESLVRRLAGVHTSDSTGDWNYSDAYELDMSKQSFVPDDFAAYAAKSVGRMSTRDYKTKPTVTSDRRNVKTTSTRTSSDRHGTASAAHAAASTSAREPTTKSTSTKSNGKQKGESGSRKK